MVGVQLTALMKQTENIIKTLKGVLFKLHKCYEII